MGEFAASTLDSPTGAALHLYRTAPADPRAVVLIFHGLAEHAGRYRRFADALSEAGLAVFAHDHRGHGSTSARDAPFRRFARVDGATTVLRDCRFVLDHARREWPGLPVFVFGHSMGGLIALDFATRHGKDLAGVAVWNSDFRNGLALKAGNLGLKVEKALKGSDVASSLFRRVMLDAWAKSIPDRRTAFDWLSHDPAVVDAYISDPLCGFTPTVSMMEDIVAIIRHGSSPEAITALPPHLPVHLLGGSEDPLTSGGEAMHWLAGRLRERGLDDVTLSIMSGARHETLNETAPIRETAVADFIRWLLARINRSPTT